jgi:hypothetical protein
MTLAKSRTGVLVLGAHRSGTSVTTGLLARLGLALPRTLMPANAWNTEGYFESSPLHVFHDRLLRAAGTSWDAYTRIDSNWQCSDEAVTLREECRAILRSEFDDAPRFVVKDPRICRFVPFWLRVLADEHIQAKAVLVVRPPFDAARSLQARDGLPVALGALVWLRHVLDAEAATRTIQRAWAPYADTLRDWRLTARRLSADLGEEDLAQAIDQQGDGLVNRTLQHHEGVLDTSQMPELLLEWLRRTEDALSSLYAQDSIEQQRGSDAIEAIRTEFDRATALFGAAEEPRYLQWMDAANAREATARDAQARAEQVSLERDLLEHERAAVRAELDRVTSVMHDLVTERDRVESERTVLMQRLAAVQQELDASRFEVAALRSSLSWRVTAPLRAVYRLMK